MKDDNPYFKPTKDGYGVQPIGSCGIEDVKDVHVTIKVDNEGTISGGHTTVVDKQDEKKHINWD